MFESKEEKLRRKQEELEQKKKNWAKFLPKKDGFVHVERDIAVYNLEDYMQMLQSQGFEIVSVIPIHPKYSVLESMTFLIMYR